ncbi:hypothetical protein AB0A60_22585 [Streptomyces sp. NPDC046275]|uniref:hypothetical protein n=1 Tax=Streptomyces sp. NPDC046275 TaxID=3157201 RepID=UPI0033FEC9BE
MNLPLTLATTTALLGLLAPAAAPADDWQQVGTDARSGISGLASEGPGSDSALFVNDNKRPGQPRLSRVSYRDGALAVGRLVWNGAEPNDLEAIEAIPGEPGAYLALAGRGIVYRITVEGATATVVDHTPLPAIAPGDDYESLALVSRDGKLAALWADRGDGPDRPATVYAAPLTFASWGQPLFGTVTRRAYSAAEPRGAGVRHVSDLAVTGSGRILAGSAADAGDDGPFDSAVSEIGRVALTSGGRVRITLAAAPTVLGTFPGRKIEAVECLPGTTGDALLGTDDENAGGFLRTAPYCA